MTTDPFATIIVTPRERYSVAPRTVETIVANTSESAEPVILNFEIAAIEEAGHIIFRGWPSEDGCQTHARMFAMSVRK
jgi:hypothetical protein